MLQIKFGGQGGIRTHGAVSRTPVFKTGAINHSTTCPCEEDSAYFVIKGKSIVRHFPSIPEWNTHAGEDMEQVVPVYR